MKDFFKMRMSQKNMTELIFCLPIFLLVFAFTRKLGSLDLTEKELLLALMVFMTLLGVWCCFVSLATIGKQLKENHRTPQHVA